MAHNSPKPSVTFDGSGGMIESTTRPELSYTMFFPGQVSRQERNLTVGSNGYNTFMQHVICKLQTLLFVIGVKL